MSLVVLFFIGLMFVLFLLSLRVPRFSAIGSELVTIGVLGTFVGVFAGLYHFDFNAIEASIPELLDGLSMAFITSIVGLSLYVLLMLIKSNEQEEGTTLDFLQQQAQMLAALKLGFTQMHDNAQDSLANQQLMITKLDESLSKIAESSQQEMIKALAEVVKDFNVQLNTQFGDNFRQLNESVKGINTWQQNYQSQVSEMEIHVQALLKEVNQATALLNKQSTSSADLLSKVDQSAVNMNDQMHESVKIVKESLDLLLRKANARS